MPDSVSSLDEAFIARQRARLEALRKAILAIEEKRSDDGSALSENQTSEPGDLEDKAQTETAVESDDALRRVDARRLGNIERALRKIDEGTYGYSDRSGDEIPRPRLEALPEAILTIEEERQLEAARRNRG